MTQRQPISTGSEWNFELLQAYDQAIGRLAAEYRLDTYPNQIEVISSEQMMDAYAAIGMPVGYHHWSFGKHFMSVEQAYRRGQMGLAYELVINSNPCIAYLMEENTITMQALVIAHACYGHNSFFKNNYLFKTWTDAEGIIDYLVFARQYITECEERHGVDEVERLLDACHALQSHGVDRYKRPRPLSAHEERERQQEREALLQQQVNDLWRTVPTSLEANADQAMARFPLEPQENLLYFVEKHAPLLEPWQREVVRIVRKIAQYFYPQRQTQVMNEGWATFWHYTLMNRLYDEGLVTDGFIMEFLQSHTSVVHQLPYDHPGYNGINPYALGFAMFTDLKRICEAPTDEDRLWFPDIAGNDWLETLHFAMQNFKDDSFIQQFLSPHLMREFHLFSMLDDDQQSELEVTAIHDDQGYHYIRNALAQQYSLSLKEPDIQIWDTDLRGGRSLTLRHRRQSRRGLDREATEVLRHLHALWGFPIVLETWEGDHCIAKMKWPDVPDAA